MGNVDKGRDNISQRLPGIIYNLDDRALNILQSNLIRYVNYKYGDFLEKKLRKDPEFSHLFAKKARKPRTVPKAKQVSVNKKRKPVFIVPKASPARQHYKVVGQTRCENIVGELDVKSRVIPVKKTWPNQVNNDNVQINIGARKQELTTFKWPRILKKEPKKSAVERQTPFISETPSVVVLMNESNMENSYILNSKYIQNEIYLSDNEYGKIQHQKGKVFIHKHKIQKTYSVKSESHMNKNPYSRQKNVISTAEIPKNKVVDTLLKNKMKNILQETCDKEIQINSETCLGKKTDPPIKKEIVCDNETENIKVDIDDANKIFKDENGNLVEENKKVKPEVITTLEVEETKENSAKIDLNKECLGNEKCYRVEVKQEDEVFIKKMDNLQEELKNCFENADLSNIVIQVNYGKETFVNESKNEEDTSISEIPENKEILKKVTPKIKKKSYNLRSMKMMTRSHKK